MTQEQPTGAGRTSRPPVQMGMARDNELSMALTELRRQIWRDGPRSPGLLAGERADRALADIGGGMREQGVRELPEESGLPTIAEDEMITLDGISPVTQRWLDWLVLVAKDPAAWGAKNDTLSGAAKQLRNALAMGRTGRQ